jgi:hypothetical protein
VPGEEAEHALVVGEDVGTEALDSSRRPRPQDLVEQDAAEPQALPAVLHDEGDLGDSGLARRLVAPDADQCRLFVRALGHQRQPLAVVHVGEEVRPVGRKPPHDGEEPLVRGVTAQPVVEGNETRLVVGADRAQPHDGAIAELDGALELGRVPLDDHRAWAHGDLSISGLG